MRTAIALSAIAMSAGAAQAITTTMTANGDWTSPVWDNGIPATGDDAVIATGVAGTANFTVDPWSGTLTLDAGSSLNAAPAGSDAVTLATGITLNGATILNGINNNTVAAITLDGGGGWDQGGSTSSHNRSLTFGGAITGTGGFTTNGNNKNRITFSVTNTFTGGLISDARDRHVLQFDAPGSAGAGDVTVLARNGNLATERSATLDLRADDVFAPSAILTLNGVGSDGWNYSAGQLLDMNTFNATVDQLFVNGTQQAAGSYTGGDAPWIVGTGILTVTSGAGDTTPPALDTFANNVADGPIFESQTVIYTVSFSEAMDASTVEATDFENAGTPVAGSISVSATGDPAVFDVSVTPGGMGTLQLQVMMGADMRDLAGNPLDTDSAITDIVSIIVNSGSPPATVMTANSDWATGTWSNGVPNGTGDAEIGASVAGTANNAVLPWSGSLTLNSGSSLNVAPVGSDAVTLATDIILNGATILNGFNNNTVAAITLDGGGVWDQGGSTSSHSRSLTFGGAITGTGGFTTNGNNKNRITFSVTNTFTGGLISDARDRHVLQFDAPGSAGAGDVTVLARNGNLATERSATLDLRANDVFAPSAILSLNGVGSDGWNYSAGQLLDMNTFNATVEQLFVNGIPQAAGSYTSGDADWIVGTGILTVTNTGVGPSVPTIIDLAIDGSGNVILTIDDDPAGMTVQAYDDFNPGTFVDISSTPGPGANQLTVDALDVDPNMDGADFYRVRR